MPAPVATASFPGDVNSEALLRDLLAVSLTGIQLLRPVYAPDGGSVVDFTFIYTNPVGLRMIGLSQQPSGSIVAQFPHALAAGVLAYYQRAFAASEPLAYETNYQADGIDNYLLFNAQRSGEQLLVSFTDTSNQPRTVVEQSLRESQAAEQAARAGAEQQRQRFYNLLMQLPAQVAVHEGPDQVFTLVNSGYQRLAPGRELQGQTVREAWPELASQGILDVLDQVYQTGEPFIGQEVPVQVDFTRTGQLEQVYLSVFFLPLRDAQGQVSGVLDYSFDVTEQVLARHRVEQLNQAAEAARAEAEAERQRLHQVLMRLPANIALLHGPEHVHNLVNLEYERLFPGRTPLGRSLREVLPELEGQGFYELFDRVYETGEPYYGAETEAWADFTGTGELQRRYYRTSFEPIRNAQGEVTEVLNFAVDVTAQVEARQQVEQLNQELEARVQQRTQQALALQAELLEAAQRQAQRRESLYQVFEQTPAAVSLLRGPSYCFEYVNPVYQAVFAGRQLVGLDFLKALPDAAEQGYLALLDGVYQTGETFFGAEVPFVAAPPDAPAHTTYFNFTYQAYRENGQIAGISTFAFDVTEQVLARQEREAQRLLLATIFEQAPVAIAILHGPQYVVELANSALSAIWGRTPAQALGQRLVELVPESAGPGFEQLLDQVRATGKAISARELPSYIERNGRRDTVYWDVVYAPLPEADGTIERLMVVSTEVSEQVKARQQVQDLNQDLAAMNEKLTDTNEELNDSNRQLRRTNEDLDTFIYTASHDLKAPITNIEGLLNLLRHHLPAAVQEEETTNQILGMMQGAVERFQLTINQLTDVSRLQHEQNQPAEQVQLAAVIRDVQLDLQPLLLSTRAQLTVDVGLDVYVLFSPKNLRSVVYNLFSNALKYHQPGQPPVVQLRASYQDQSIVLAVQDKGLGVSEQQQTRLFRLFQRLHVHVEGTGVGLYMVKRMVENAGGTITVQSEVGVGTTFTVILPTARP